MATLNYKINDRSTSGHVIRFIHGMAPNCIVFNDENGDVQWETSAQTLAPHETNALTRYDALLSRANASTPWHRLGRVKNDLAQALFSALSCTTPNPTQDFFAHCDQQITAFENSGARYDLAIASTVALAVVGAGAWATNALLNGNAPITISLAAGGAGAWLSSLQRATRLVPDSFETPGHIRLQGTLRVLIGMTFGLVALAATNAGILLPNANQSNWSVGLITFVAGFSERLIPGVLEKMEGASAAGSGSPGTPAKP